ncbi:MAG: DUF4349 domain-containing protein [Anaerolineae bacterium]
MMRMNSRLVAGIVAVLVLAVIAGCGGSAEYQPDEAAMGSNGGWDRGVASEPAMEMEEVAMEKAAMDPDDEGVAYAAERLIIRSGNISMYVEDTLAAQATIEQMVESMAADGAFVVSANEYGGTEERQPQITIAIRIPAARFDETMDRLAEMAVNVISSNESAEDVTEEYVDLEARLESLEAARQRLLEIMEEARNTEDLLEAEQQLTEREAQIESIKGRMQYLEQSARLSSIWIELQPYILNQPVGDEWRPAETVRRGVDALLDGLRGFGDFAIFFAIAILPWLLVIGAVVALIVVFFRWRGRVRRRRQAASPDSGGEDQPQAG